jgi:putative acetyltransferase
MEIKLGNFADPSVKALLEYHLRGMHQNSPPGHVFALDWSGLQKPEIKLYTGWLGEKLVVMGALKTLPDSMGEIKSMRVAEGEGGKGYGALMLEHLIAEARHAGMKRLSLETGTSPAFEPALRLYRSRGFVVGDAFADYEQSAFCRFFHLDLSTVPRQ